MSDSSLVVGIIFSVIAILDLINIFICFYKFIFKNKKQIYKTLSRSCVVFVFFAILVTVFLQGLFSNENIKNVINYDVSIAPPEVIEKTELKNFIVSKELEGTFFLTSGKINNTITYTYRVSTEKGQKYETLKDDGNVYIEEITNNEKPKLVYYKQGELYTPISIKEGYSIYSSIHTKEISAELKKSFIYYPKNSYQIDTWYTFYIPKGSFIESYNANLE